MLHPDALRVGKEGRCCHWKKVLFCGDKLMFLCSLLPCVEKPEEMYDLLEELVGEQQFESLKGVFKRGCWRRQRLA